MKMVLNILLPLGLAFVAGVINYAVLSRTTAMQSYIEVTAPLKPGDSFKMPMLKQAKVAAKVPGAIPWEERHVLATLRAPRAIETGDWILLSDVVPQVDSGIGLSKDEVALNVSLEGIVIEPKLLKIGQPIGFVIRKAEASETSGAPAPTKATDSSEYQIVGPFRLATLGEFATHDPESDEEDRQRPPKTISVAVPSFDGKTLDAESQLLARAIEQSRITAIVLYPTKVAPASKTPAAETPTAEAPVETPTKSES
jgi:hypothetical protein